MKHTPLCIALLTLIITLVVIGCPTDDSGVFSLEVPEDPCCIYAIIVPDGQEVVVLPFTESGSRSTRVDAEEKPGLKAPEDIALGAIMLPDSLG